MDETKEYINMCEKSVMEIIQSRRIYSDEIPLIDIVAFKERNTPINRLIRLQRKYNDLLSRMMERTKGYI